MRSAGFNPSTLSKRMGKSPVAGGASTNVTSGDVPAKNPVTDNDNGANEFKDGKWTAQSWAAAGKKGKRPAHSFGGGKPRGGNPVRPLPALGKKGPKKDFLNRGQAKKPMVPGVGNARVNALQKRLSKGK